MSDIDRRLAAIEARLERLERLGHKTAEPAVRGRTAQAQEEAAAREPPTATRGRHEALAASEDPWAAFERPQVHRSRTVPITQILGWTGATAFVLAMAYLIRLALDTGWLTPERQLALAVTSGVSLIVAGLWLRASDRLYASLLPAGGLVILFLSIYGAHLYYHFIEAEVAAGLVIVACLGALWLGWLFAGELYALFAVVGSYSAPFLIPVLSGTVMDLVVYFSAWSVAFCLYAIAIGNRRPYLVAAYLALLGFNAIWRQIAREEWPAALSFQLIQFAIFLGGAIGFSVRQKSPMSAGESLAHLPLLLIFYALQYELLQEHLPALAPWIALASAAALLLAYGIARLLLDLPLAAGAMLVGAYAALALFHAGYMELVPNEFGPWVALLVVPVAAGYVRIRGSGEGIGLPMAALIGLIFALNYLRVVVIVDSDDVPGHDLLAVLYALELYAAYYLTRRKQGLALFSLPALYAGHVATLCAAVQIFDSRLAVSLAWGAVALACLALAFRVQDATLGKSSLLIFGASAIKVLLFDLSSAAPLVRIGTLIVLGVTLYVGGWMYKRVDSLEPAP